MQYPIPAPVLNILKSLTEAGFDAHIVGGCVRDLLLGREPKDWDVTTSARPEEIQKLFPDSFYENAFGTVGVKTPPFLREGRPDREHDVVEVTTYRLESAYSDARRPDEVRFTDSLEEDLKRRDFTMNAVALGIQGARGKGQGAKEREDERQETSSAETDPLSPQPFSLKLVDPFGGQRDIEAKVIRAVGQPEERFQEDALRLMRAIRLYAELRDPKAGKDAPRWKIDDATWSALRANADLIRKVSWERVRDEFSRIILSDSPARGVDILQQAGILRHILPEIEEGIGVGQNLHHIYTVYEHNLRALKYCPSKKLDVRLAALLHDVGKPRTKRGEGYRSTFYNHDHVGARMTEKILSRFRYPREIIERAVLLVDNHLFYYNVGEVTEASVRRLIRKVGLENMPDLLDVRVADRLGSGVPKAKPYRLRHLEFMIEKVSRDPVSVKMLKVNGHALMEKLGMKPGPAIGAVLNVLLAEVIEDPSKNTEEALLARADELKDKNLTELHELAKDVIEEKREADEGEIKKKYWVQ